MSKVDACLESFIACDRSSRYTWLVWERLHCLQVIWKAWGCRSSLTQKVSHHCQTSEFIIMLFVRWQVQSTTGNTDILKSVATCNYKCPRLDQMLIWVSGFTVGWAPAISKLAVTVLTTFPQRHWLQLQIRDSVSMSQPVVFLKSTMRLFVKIRQRLKCFMLKTRVGWSSGSSVLVLAIWNS